MAKVLGVKELEAKVTLTLKDKITKGEVLEQIGSFVKNRIYQNTKAGKSLATGNSIKSLSPNYIKTRKRFQEWNQVGDFFSPSRSNLTLTGQLLNAIAFRVNKIKSQVEVFVQDTLRKPTPPIPQKSWVEGRSTKKYASKKPEPSLTNKEVAKRVADKGRPFLGLDETGRDRVKLTLVQEIRKRLRQAGLNK